jgi:hypothetical protein
MGGWNVPGDARVMLLVFCRNGVFGAPYRRRFCGEDGGAWEVAVTNNTQPLEHETWLSFYTDILRVNLSHSQSEVSPTPRERLPFAIANTPVAQHLFRTAMPSSPPRDAANGSPPRKRPRTRAPVPNVSSSTHVIDFAPRPSSSEPPSEMNHFPIQPLNRFGGASASIKRPREIAHFSYDENHEYRDDESSINYYVPPPMGADLKAGFDTFKHFEEKEDPHLDSLLRALVEKEKKAGDQAKTKADFVTWRGMMTKVRLDVVQRELARK